MSDDLAAAAPIVPGYAGHADAPARRLSDQQVRAWVGEMLADLQDRMPVDAVRGRLDALLLRCEFADQHVVTAIEDQRFGEPELAAAVEACDRALVEAARPGRTTGPDGLEALVAALERAFDKRSSALAALLKR
jgi:hypothetical protein